MPPGETLSEHLRAAAAERPGAVHAPRRCLLLADGHRSHLFWESLTLVPLPRRVEVLGRVHPSASLEAEVGWDLPCVGEVEELPALTRRLAVDTIILTSAAALQGPAVRILRRCRAEGTQVLPPLAAHERLTLRTPLLVGEPVAPDARPFLRCPYVHLGKRLLDLGLVLLALPPALLLLGLCALALLLTEGPPVLYCQERVGVAGRLFRICKLRTMVRDAERLSGPVWATQDDPRITRLGHFLRRTRLDEVPQLFNILRGEMSLVGPRPERPAFVERFRREVPFYAQRLLVRPGLTGWAQVRHHYDRDLDDVHEKLRHDLFYLRHLSLGLDLRILLATVGVVLRRRGAH